MIRPGFVCLSFVTALFWAPPALAEGEAADAVILASGERVACEVLELDERTVRVRIGTQTYSFERASLSSVERAGQAQLDEAHLRFVRDLAPRLVHTDKRLAAAARAGLLALGEEGRPYIEAVAAASRNLKLRSALRAVHAANEEGAAQTPPQPSAMLDAWIERARGTLALESKQEPGFRKALESFFQDGRSSGDWQGAWKRLRSALEQMLTAEQMKQFDAMRQRGSGG